MRKQFRDDGTRFRSAATVILGVLVFFTLLPILLVVIASVTDETALIAGGYTYFPAKLSLDSYYYMLKQSEIILRAYGVTIFVTVVGTLTSVLITTMLAYPMSRPNFRFRNALAFFVFFTMLFNGGIVSSYIMWSKVFQIKDTIWALIVPNYLVTAFNVFLVRNYYVNSVPLSIIESAQIDGASELRIFFEIMLPLAVPSVATISLFTGLIYWNDWINGLYYLTDAKLFGIQNLLIRIMNNIQFLKVGSNMALLGTMNIDLPGTSVRMAMAVIGILPIVVIYPFLQKHFIKGIVLGAVKG
ncbi:MAG TPA: carbohydrate ABC transporter permease [Feifaniaceae bacterium]|nr:carbohydrate ABC transporter permease [Feifaniaceae bacterium]